jgi:hypothetical membrane protein
MGGRGYCICLVGKKYWSTKPVHMDRMRRSPLLLYGPIAAVLLALGIFVLALLVPGYSQLRQTVSEIGEIGSPARMSFAILLVVVASCLLVFAAGLSDLAAKANRSPVGAYLVGAMGISAAGVGVFAFPHPLHNVFGLSELIGYQAPWLWALNWRKEADMRPAVIMSFIMGALVWAAILLNLSSLNRHGSLYLALAPYYGLVQRSLFFLWFGWCAALGLMLRRVPS